MKNLILLVLTVAMASCGRSGVKDLTLESTSNKEQAAQLTPYWPKGPDPYWPTANVCKTVYVVGTDNKDDNLSANYKYQGENIKPRVLGQLVVTKNDTEVCFKLYTYNQWFAMFSHLNVTVRPEDLPDFAQDPHQTPRQALWQFHSSVELLPFTTTYPHLRVKDYVQPFPHVETDSLFCVPLTDPQMAGAAKLYLDLLSMNVKCCGGDWVFWHTDAVLDGKRVPSDSRRTYAEVDLTQCD